MPQFRRFAAGVLTFVALLCPTCRAAAQRLTRPARHWETIETTSFRIHYPAEMREWVLPVAERMESYASKVNDLVGNRPSARVTVMVEDPSNVANGFAVPLLESPVIFLWATPPAPSPSFGTHRGWGEILAVHEYGHIAHLTFPTRNPNEARLWRLLPTRVGPVARKSPPWVIEGYATYIEGMLTGSGRPHSVGRAAILRQWALEGRLPRYEQLDNQAAYLGGAMRYLVGSAFLEWLAQRKGSESLNHVWRRMSARVQRSFVDAFRGVYGAAPDDVYGAFFTEVVGKALDAKRELQAAGIIEGDLVQKLNWGTGEPAVSKDGSMVAVVLRTGSVPSRLVVWHAADEPLDSNVVRARRRMLARDPKDVAPFDSFPPPKRSIATLYPVAGRGHDNPRWLPDGDRLLVVRDEPLGDGASRPDLFIWNRKSGELHRVTHGAGIRYADPAPDGLSAAATHCANGICDIVRVDLSSGHMVKLAAGSPFVVWHRPRWSPDGRRIAASVQRDGLWSVALIDAAPAGGETAIRIVDPEDGASRYAPAWTRDGYLVVVSERGGVPNLELLDPDGASVQTISRVTGAVAAPDVGPDGRVWYLSLHAKGYDVRRIGLGNALASSAGGVVTLDARFFPAAPKSAGNGTAFTQGPITGPHEYGLGPRGWRVLPGASAGPDGEMISLMVANMDPVGRWSVLLQGGYGEKGSWRGGSLATALRAHPVELDGSFWYTDHAPSRQAAGSLASLDIDSRYAGLGAAARLDRIDGGWGYTLRFGGSVGHISGNQLDRAGRTMGFADARARRTWTYRGLNVTPQLYASASQGSTGGDSWNRTLVTGSLSLTQRRQSLLVEATAGSVTSAGSMEFGRAFEQFAVGGTSIPYFDPAYLSQRVSLPAVPVGYAAGRRLALFRVSTWIMGWRPYAVWAAAGDSIAHFRRLLGIEQEMDFAPIGFARLPRTRVRFGLGYSIDEPYKEKVRPYASVIYRP